MSVQTFDQILHYRLGPNRWDMNAHPDWEGANASLVTHGQSQLLQGLAGDDIILSKALYSSNKP